MNTGDAVTAKIALDNQRLRLKQISAAADALNGEKLNSWGSCALSYSSFLARLFSLAVCRSNLFTTCDIPCHLR